MADGAPWRWQRCCRGRPDGALGPLIAEPIHFGPHGRGRLPEEPERQRISRGLAGIDKCQSASRFQSDGLCRALCRLEHHASGEEHLHRRLRARVDADAEFSNRCRHQCRVGSRRDSVSNLCRRFSTLLRGEVGPMMHSNRQGAGFFKTLASLVFGLLLAFAVTTASAQTSAPPALSQDQLDALVKAITTSVLEKLKSEQATTAKAPASAVEPTDADEPDQLAIFAHQAGGVLQTIPTFGKYLVEFRA